MARLRHRIISALALLAVVFVPTGAVAAQSFIRDADPVPGNVSFTITASTDNCAVSNVNKLTFETTYTLDGTPATLVIKDGDTIINCPFTKFVATTDVIP